jgi:hypothetical protein
MLFQILTSRIIQYLTQLLSENKNGVFIGRVCTFSQQLTPIRLLTVQLHRCRRSIAFPLEFIP